MTRGLLADRDCAGPRQDGAPRDAVRRGQPVADARCGPARSTDWRCSTSSACARSASPSIGWPTRRRSGDDAAPAARPHRERPARAIDVEVHHTLLEALRDDLGLTGTKECCLVGECGACTVLVDGRSVDSCLMLAVEADGAAVTTVEGLAAGDRLHPLQQAFLDTGAAQCGFCIPGQLVSAEALLALHPAPDPRRGRGGPGRQSLSLRRLRADHRSGPRGSSRRRPRNDASDTGGRGLVGRPGRERGAAVSVGDPAARVGGRARVTGEQQYVADLPHDDAST